MNYLNVWFCTMRYGPWGRRNNPILSDLQKKKKMAECND